MILAITSDLEGNKMRKKKTSDLERNKTRKIKTRDPEGK